MHLNIIELTLIYQLIAFIIVASCTSLVHYCARYKSNIDIKLSFEDSWMDKVIGYKHYARHKDNLIALVLSLIVALLSLYPTLSNAIFKPYEIYEFVNTSRVSIPNSFKLGLIDMSSVTCVEADCALDILCKNIKGCGIGYGLNNYTLSPTNHSYSSEVITNAINGTITTLDGHVWSFGVANLLDIPLLAGSYCMIVAAIGMLGTNVSIVQGYAVNNSDVSCMPRSQADINTMMKINNSYQIAFGDEYLTLSRPRNFRTSIARRYVQSTELKCFTNNGCSRATTVGGQIYGFTNTPINLNSICQHDDFNDYKLSEVCSILLPLQYDLEGNKTIIMQVVTNSSDSVQFMSYVKVTNNSYTLDYKTITVTSYHNIINYTNTNNLSIVLAYNDSGVIYDNKVNTEFGYMNIFNDITGYFDNTGHVDWFNGPLHNFIVDLATHVKGTEITVAATFYNPITGIEIHSNWLAYVLVVLCVFISIKVACYFSLDSYWVNPLRHVLLSSINVKDSSNLDVIGDKTNIMLLVNNKYQIICNQDEITPLETSSDEMLKNNDN